MKTTLKSIGAVLLGILTIVILSVLTDTILEKAGIFPPPSRAGLFIPWMLALALAYRTLYAFIGGYVTARCAPKNPKKHIIILEIIGTVLGILGVVAGWNLSQHWYPIALVFTSFVAVWYGGKLGMSHLSVKK